MVENPPNNEGEVKDTGLIPMSENPLEQEMATHSIIHAWENSMDRGTWWATSPWGHKELNTMEHTLTTYTLETSLALCFFGKQFSLYRSWLNWKPLNDLTITCGHKEYSELDCTREEIYYITL